MLDKNKTETKNFLCRSIFTSRGNQSDEFFQLSFQNLNGFTDIGIVTGTRLDAVHVFCDQNERGCAKTHYERVLNFTFDLDSDR